MNDNIIYAYTRDQAIEDGVLVDVSKMAREAGFRFPVAVTRAVWEQYVAVPEGVSCQDEKGRLWDILCMLMFRIRVTKHHDDSGEMLFKLAVRNDNEAGDPPLVTLKSHVGPGDDAEPVITIMLPDED